MKVVAFVLVATKGSIHQDYNPNKNSLDLVVDRYNPVMDAKSHNMVIQLVNKWLRINLFVVNQAKELESEGPILESIGLKDLPEMVDVQQFESVTGVKMY